jgi:hypothetical protein
LNGCDAVVSPLGAGLSPFREVSLLTVATGALVTAMTRNGVRHLVCISALGVGDSRGHGGFVFDRLFLPLLLSHAYKDKDGQEGDLLDRLLGRPAFRRQVDGQDPHTGRQVPHGLQGEHGPGQCCANEP